MSEEKPDEQQQGKRRWWRIRLDGVKAEWPISGGLTLAGTGVIGVIVVVVAYLVIHHEPERQVEVPSLVGMPGAAEAQLAQRGLSLHATCDQVSDQPPGTVLQTDPAGGTRLGRRQRVSLVLAAARPTPTPTGPSETTVTRSGGAPGPAPGSGTRGQTAAASPNLNPNQSVRQVPELTGLDLDGGETKAERQQPCRRVDERRGVRPGGAIKEATI